MGLCGAMGGLWGGNGCVTQQPLLSPPPKRTTTKRYNIMAFNAADKVNFATWHQVGSRGYRVTGLGHMSP